MLSFSIKIYSKIVFLGESIIIFACMKPQQQETRLWLTLEPRSNLAVRLLFYLIEF